MNVIRPPGIGIVNDSRERQDFIFRHKHAQGNLEFTRQSYQNERSILIKVFKIEDCLDSNILDTLDEQDSNTHEYKPEAVIIKRNGVVKQLKSSRAAEIDTITGTYSWK